MREYLVRYVKQRWHVVRVEAGQETVLDLHFGDKREAEAVAKHLQHAKRPAGQQPERAVNN